jgi:hypothetical protein
VQKNVSELYQELIQLMVAKAGSDANIAFHTIEIGSSSGLLSETTKFALWELFKLTTRTQVRAQKNECRVSNSQK